MASQDTSATVVALDLVPVSIRPTDSRAGPQCQSQDGSRGATPGPFAPEAGATTVMDIHRLGRALGEFASLLKAYLYRSTTSAFARLSLNPLCQLFCSLKDLCDQKQGLLGKILLVATFLATVLMMWPSMQSAVDSRRSLALARWTALKDFFELCEAHNWELPACEASTQVAPGPPPDVKTRDIKHRDPLRSDLPANSGLLALVGIGCLLFSVALAATKREVECLHCREKWPNPALGPEDKFEYLPFTQRKRKRPTSPQQGSIQAQEQTWTDEISSAVDMAFSSAFSLALSDDHLRKRLASENTGNAAKLACPYFIKNPSRFAHSRVCSGPGWDDRNVHRVKEHLYRRHELEEPFGCHRCHKRFSAAVDLVEHYQMDSPCTATSARIRDTEAGFDRGQRQEMDSLRRDKLSNVDYWKRIYGILFHIPENSSAIPSPYYEDLRLDSSERAKAR